MLVGRENDHAVPPAGGDLLNRDNGERLTTNRGLPHGPFQGQLRMAGAVDSHDDSGHVYLLDARFFAYTAESRSRSAYRSEAHFTRFTGPFSLPSRTLFRLLRDLGP